MLKNSVAKKLVMSVTGLAMTLFIIVHLLGNMTFFLGPDGINSYAAALHSFGLVIWTFRLSIGLIFLLHVYFGIRLTIENRAAASRSYAVNGNTASTFAGRNMIWTGLLIGLFLAGHLVHFTLQLIDPASSAAANPDVLGRPDVFLMIARGFRSLIVDSLYVGAMAALGLHLSHSIQSSFQTLGLNSEKTFPLIMKGGIVAAVLIFIGFAALPVSVLTGIADQVMSGVITGVMR